MSKEGVRIFELNHREGFMLSQSYVPLNGFHADDDARETARTHGVVQYPKESPYTDSRKGGYLNATALTEMGRHWQDIFDDLSWCNAILFSEKLDEITIAQARSVTAVAISLPSYLTLQSENQYAKYGEIPDNIARVYRTAAGIYKAISGIRTTSYADIDAAKLSPEDIYILADHRKYLSNANGEVCAAPTQQIVKAMSALFYRDFADPTRSELSQYFSDQDSLIKYAEIYASTREIIEAVDQEAKHYSKPQRGKKSDKAQKRRDKAFVELRQTAIAKLREMQNEVNRLLGYDPEAVEHPTIVDFAIRRANELKNSRP